MCRYWIGYWTQNGMATGLGGLGGLGPINSSRSPYQHFMAYLNSSDTLCAAASPRHAYNVFEWW